VGLARLWFVAPFLPRGPTASSGGRNHREIEPSGILVAFDPTLLFGHWYGPLLAASLAYLLVSALAVHLEHPVRWAIWGVLAFTGLRLIAAFAELTSAGNARGGGKDGSVCGLPEGHQRG
jgi:hypothetical protein